MNASVCVCCHLLCALLLLPLLAVLWCTHTTRVWWSAECVDVGGGHEIQCVCVCCVCSQRMWWGGMKGCIVS